jgi:hypothetical protein
MVHRPNPPSASPFPATPLYPDGPDRCPTTLGCPGDLAAVLRQAAAAIRHAQPSRFAGLLTACQVCIEWLERAPRSMRGLAPLHRTLATDLDEALFQLQLTPSSGRVRTPEACSPDGAALEAVLQTTQRLVLTLGTMITDAPG